MRCLVWLPGVLIGIIAGLVSFILLLINFDISGGRHLENYVNSGVITEVEATIEYRNFYREDSGFT